MVPVTIPYVYITAENLFYCLSPTLTGQLNCMKIDPSWFRLVGFSEPVLNDQFHRHVHLQCHQFFFSFLSLSQHSSLLPCVTSHDAALRCDTSCQGTATHISFSGSEHATESMAAFWKKRQENYRVQSVQSCHLM